MDASEANRVDVGWYISAAVVPIVGFYLAILQFNRSNAGPAFGLLITSCVSGLIWIVVLSASVGSTTTSEPTTNTTHYLRCVMNAETREEQLNCQP